MVIPPSSRRGRLIAGQAAIVAVLIAIAWATLLQGGDSDTLSGIDAPGPSLDLDSRDVGDGKGKKGGAGDGRRGGSGNGQGQGGGGNGGSGGGASLADAGPAGLETGSGGPGTTPAGSQYSDTLSLLKDELGLGTSQSRQRLKRR
jgi:hypothetical protein